MMPTAIWQALTLRAMAGIFSCIVAVAPVSAHDYFSSDPPPEVQSQIESDSPDIRRRALGALHMYFSPLTDSLIISALYGTSDSDRIQALGILFHCHEHLWSENLMNFAESKNVWVRRSVAGNAGLHFLRKPDARLALLRLIQDPDPAVRSDARWSLGNQKVYCKNRRVPWWGAN